MFNTLRITRKSITLQIIRSSWGRQVGSSYSSDLQQSMLDSFALDIRPLCVVLNKLINRHKSPNAPFYARVLGNPLSRDVLIRGLVSHRMMPVDHEWRQACALLKGAISSPIVTVRDSLAHPILKLSGRSQVRDVDVPHRHNAMAFIGALCSTAYSIVC